MSENGQGKRAVLYARVSSDDRGKDGRNLAGQLEMGREYAERKGWRVVAELAEDERGASGADFDLPQLTRAMDMAAAGEFDVLVVRELDRLARGLAKQLVVEERLKGHGVKIEYVLGEYPDSPEGNLMKNVRGVVAEYERLKIIERSLRGRRNKARGGKWPCDGHPPYGYDKVGEASDAYLAINETEAETVQRIYDLYIGRNGSEPMNFQSIAAVLTAEGVPPPNRGIGQDPEQVSELWHRGTVRRIVNHRRNIGEFSYGDIEVPLPELALIDEETFEEAQERMAQSRARAVTKRKYEYLLAGYVRCSCGMGMSGKPMQRGKYLYYCCNSKTNKRHADSCDERMININDADPLVWDWLKSKVMEPEELDRTLRAMMAQRESDLQETRDELAIVDGLIADVEGSMRNLAGALAKATDEIAVDALQSEMRMAEKKRSSLTVRQNSLKAQIEQGQLTEADIARVGELAEEIRRKMDNPPMERRRELLHALGVQVELRWKDGVRGLECICSLEVEQAHRSDGISTQNGTSNGTPKRTWLPLKSVGQKLSSTKGPLQNTYSVVVFREWLPLE